MKQYRELFSNPGILRVLTSQLVARFAFGMMSIGFVLHIQNTQHSYAIAGIALGAETVGAAIAGPVLGRKIGSWGTRRVIGFASLITSAAIIAIAVLQLHPLAVIGLAFIVGLSSPPVQSSARTIYPTMIPKSQHQLMFNVDATSQELIWVIGPVLSTLVASMFGPASVLLLMAAIQLTGAAWYLSNREISGLVIPAPSKRLGGVLRNRTVYALVIIGTLLIGSFSGVEVGTVAILPVVEAGWVVAMLSLGSLIGGLVLGPRVRGKHPLTWLMALLLAGYLLSFLAPTNPFWLATCWFIAGIAIAPALGLLGVAVSKTLPLSDTAEAYGWIGTGQMMGFSAGAAIAGVAIDTVSPTSALIVSGVFGLAALIAAFASADVMPKIESD